MPLARYRSPTCHLNVRRAPHLGSWLGYARALSVPWDSLDWNLRSTLSLCRLCPCVAQYTQRQMIGTRDASPTNVHASHEPETHASSTSSLARGHPTPRSKPKITSPSARCARACATNMAQCRLRIERCAKIKRRKKKYFGSLILSLGEERGL